MNLLFVADLTPYYIRNLIKKSRPFYKGRTFSVNLVRDPRPQVGGRLLPMFNVLKRVWKSSLTIGERSEVWVKFGSHWPDSVEGI